MNLRDRIGIDLGRMLPVEEGIAWAGANEVRHIDAQLDIAPNALESFDEARCKAVREACEQHGVKLALAKEASSHISELPSRSTSLKSEIKCSAKALTPYEWPGAVASRMRMQPHTIHQP